MASGEYEITVPITFRGKAITVLSEAGPDETTIRMGTPTDPKQACVVTFENNEAVESILEGFTISGGRGIFNPSVNASGGGGIVFLPSSGTLNNCVIVQNRADAGGGVLSSGNTFVTVNDCTITGNSATIIGAGVYAVSGSSMILTSCTITGNSVVRSGGGAACSLGAALTVSNCTIWSNSVGDTWGGGGLLSWQGTVTVTNSIIWANTSQKGREISVEEPTSTLTIAYSDVAGGQAEINVEDGCVLDWGEGNIDTDPCFVDPENDDYHL